HRPGEVAVGVEVVGAGGRHPRAVLLHRDDRQCRGALLHAAGGRVPSIGVGGDDLAALPGRRGGRTGRTGRRGQASVGVGNVLGEEIGWRPGQGPRPGGRTRRGRGAGGRGGAGDVGVLAEPNRRAEFPLLDQYGREEARGGVVLVDVDQTVMVFEVLV